MAGLPKKYAKMGFKKGWAAYKRSKKSVYMKKYSTIKLKTRKRSMVKRRRIAKRRVSRRSASIMGINTARALAAALYGAIRMKTSNMIAPYTSKIPLGNISDEAGMLLVTTLGKKFLFKKAGTLREAMTAGQTIELARIGESVMSGNLGINLFGNSAPAESNGYNFA